jgi:hypothetical protein
VRFSFKDFFLGQKSSFLCFFFFFVFWLLKFDGLGHKVWGRRSRGLAVLKQLHQTENQMVKDSLFAVFGLDWVLDHSKQFLMALLHLLGLNILVCIPWICFAVIILENIIEGIQDLIEDTPRKLKGTRELLNLECSFNYDAKGASSRRGKGKVHAW